MVWHLNAKQLAELAAGLLVGWLVGLVLLADVERNCIFKIIFGKVNALALTPNHPLCLRVELVPLIVWEAMPFFPLPAYVCDAAVAVQETRRRSSLSPKRETGFLCLFCNECIPF